MKKLVRASCLIIVLLLPSIVFAGYTSCGTNCYHADTATYTDVQAALDAANNASGGTVQIPDGNVTYTTRAGWFDTAIRHDLKIVGTWNGTSGTTITDGTSDEQVFWFRVDGTTKFELCNLKLISKTGTNTNSTLNIHGTSPNVLVHDMYFDMTGINGGRMVLLGNPNDASPTYGVISRCTFYNPAGVGQGISVEGDSAGTSGIWESGTTYGSAAALYIEGNTFNFTKGPGDGAFDAYDGAKIVFRYNTVIGTQVGWHGNDSAGSAHSAEVYNNAFTSAASSINFIGNLRGGTALIHNNTTDSSYATGMTLALYRTCEAMGRDGKICQGAGTYDGNEVLRGGAGGYPCYQQPGTSGTTGTDLSPIFAWNNKKNGTTDITFSNNANFLNPACGETYAQSDYVQINRDYCEHDNTTACGSFSSFAYTPYTCPHPLAGTGSCNPTVAGTAEYIISVSGGSDGGDPPLTVTKSGTGMGTVSSSPSGINCGSTCLVGYNIGTAVTLTASPSGGSTFTGWGGACTGTGVCVVTMDAAKSVTATFTVLAVPASPSNLSINAITSSQITLSWTDNSSNESGFTIERCKGAGCSNFAQIASVAANVNIYSDSGLPAGTNYSYRVRAYNSAANSGYSNTESASTISVSFLPWHPVISRQLHFIWGK